MVQQLVGALSHRCGRQPSVLQALQHCPLCCHAIITWAPWPVMAEHESTQRLHAREVSQPPHGLNAINCDVFNTSIDISFFPDRALEKQRYYGTKGKPKVAARTCSSNPHHPGPPTHGAEMANSLSHLAIVGFPVRCWALRCRHSGA